MRKRSFLPLVLVGFAGTGAGCGLILGLGDYKDGGTGGSGAGASASSANASSTSASSTAASSSASSSGHGGTGGTGGAGGTGGGMVCIPGSTLPCIYHGPMNTDGVGICVHATQTCVMDGSGYTACNGEVDPNPAGEVCGNGKDDDCNGMPDDGCSCTIGTDYPCYNGPGNSDMFPPCHDGKHTCVDGHSFGACSGEQDPVAEVCGNGVDDNCDGTPDDIASGCICVPGAMQACWTGPVNKQHVGDCKDGMQACAADGKSWLPCMGQTLPATEDCAVKGDEDCDGIPCSELIWGNGWPGAQGTRTAWDSASNIYVVGDISASVDFGGGSLVPQGGDDALVVKLDSTGKHLWSQRFGDAANQDVAAVGVDAQDNVIIGGTFAGTMKIGNTTLSSSSSSDKNLFVAKFKPDGTALWAVGFGDASDQTLRDLAVDKATGDVVVVGEFAGSVAFGNGLPSLASTGKHDAFIARLRAVDGAALWRLGIGYQTTPQSEQSASSVAIDPGGAIVVAGDYGYQGTGITLGATNYSTANIWLARYDGLGNFVTGKGYPATVGVTGSTAHVASFSNGDILFAGRVGVNPGLGGPAINSGAFAARFSSNLVHQWSQGFGVNTYDSAAMVDHADHVVLAQGGTQFNFGGHIVNASGNGAGALTKLDGMGTWIWSDTYATAIGSVAGLAASSADLIAVSGAAYNSPSFGGNSYGMNGTSNLFLVTFYP